MQRNSIGQSELLMSSSFAAKYLIKIQDRIKSWVIHLGGPNLVVDQSFNRLMGYSLLLERSAKVGTGILAVFGLIGFTFKTLLLVPLVWLGAFLTFLASYIIENYALGLTRYISNDTLNEFFDETAIETPRRKRAELILALHQKMLKSIMYTLIFSMTVPLALYFIPLLNYFGAHPAPVIPAPIVAGLLGYPFISHLLLLGLPIFLGGDMYSKWINSNIYYSQYADEAYLAYTFYDPKLQPLYMPNLDKRKGNLFLGYSTVTDEMVILKESDLKLGIMIIWAVGTAKTSTIFKPIAQQLIQKQIYFIRDYHMLKEKGILFDCKGGANYVAGFARQMGIPEMIINHIKPHDPNTRSINVMHGDVLEVVNLLLEVLTPVVKKSDFFVQSERDYLRLHTYREKYTTLVKQADENKRAQEAGETSNIIEPSLEDRL